MDQSPSDRAAARPTGRGSLRWRFVTAISALVAVVLLSLVAVLALTSRTELRRDIERRAEGFAVLAAAPICEAYETYFASGASKFREIVGDVARRNPDLVDLAIYDTQGRQLFDLASLERASFGPSLTQPQRRLAPSRLLDAVRGLEMVAWGRPSDGRYTVVMPYIEEWGRHRYSVAFDFSYAGLHRATRTAAGRLLWLSLGSLALAAVIATLLARQSLGPLEELIGGARDLADGRLDRRLAVDTGDEFEDLAETFNHMATRLSSTIADLEGSNRALQETNRQLQEMERLKADLLANVSHELRTPLTALLGYTEALQTRLLGPVNEAQAEALETSRRNVHRLLGMIEEVLAFARQDSAGGPPLELGPLDLRELAEERIAAQPGPRRREVDVELEAPDDLPSVIGDGPRLGQVLDNLLGNALKFTPAGGRVVVRLAAEERDVLVEVADTGIGIAPAEQPLIFERFYQVDPAAHRRFGGIGLGLAIVRQILDAHGCRIEVDSAPSAGTTFRFRLPRADVATGRDAAARRVALIEPDEQLAAEIADLLRRDGAWVRTADRYASGRRLLEDFAPQAVVVERLLPDGDGFDLFSLWREEGEHPSVITLSSRPEEALARRLGAAAHLVKPVSAAAVVAALGVATAAPTPLASEGAPGVRSR
jgi:signal transduction histidine kinase/ActR/RegA family two-component response regulator